MALFAYKGRDAQGALVRGMMEGADSSAVAGQLSSMGVIPIEISASSASGAQGWGGVLTRLKREKVTNLDILLFSRQMHTLLKAGVPMARALAGLQESATNEEFKAILGRVREGLESGRDLSASLQREAPVFSPFFISMVRTGEMTGKLEEIFLELFNHLEFENFIRDQIRSALRYPTFVVVAMAIALVVVSVFVIPVFAKVFTGFGKELPFMTKIIIGYSNFMVAAWPLMLGALVIAVTAFRAFVKTSDGKYRWDRLRLRIPIAGKIVLKATMARFARSFALAYRSGVPVIQALSLVAQVVDNDFIARRVEKMRQGVERGESVLRTSIESGIFTPLVLQMIAVGEESGALDDLMQEVAEMYQRDVEYELKTLGAQVEPILIMGLGVMVLILALGVFLPMWDLGRAALH
ncbi:MAG: type II secretion system F family protein [Burkholderiales bacterium]|nr:type II secretion system F family protein [Burkholderiales bacterium]